MIYARTMPCSRSPRAWAPLGAAPVLGALALVAGGCGGEEARPIPTRTARDIVARLDEVSRRVDASACNDLRDDSLPALRREVKGLPSNVDGDVRTTLEDGLGRLEELVQAECDEPDPTPTQTPDSSPQIDTTPEPSTQPDSTEPSQPQTPSPTPGDSGAGSGAGDGTGNGGGSSDGGAGEGSGSGSGDDAGGNGGGDSGFVRPDGGGGGPGGAAAPTPDSGEAT